MSENNLQYFSFLADKIVGMNYQLLVFVGILVVFLWLGYYVGRRLSLRDAVKNKEIDEEPVSQVEPSADGNRQPVIVLYGVLRDVEQILEKGVSKVAAENAIEAINDYLTMSAWRVKAYKGVFERYDGHGFIAFWGLNSLEAEDPWRAVRCALELRKDIISLNASRNVDGLKAISIGVAVHTGQGLIGRVGPAGQMTKTVVGEVNKCASTLEKVAAAAGMDMLISQPLWEQVVGHFVGEKAGEAKLSPNTGLVSYIYPQGFKDEEGKSVIVEVPKTEQPVEKIEVEVPNIERPKLKKWLVNNGSQIVGPFEAEEIAQRLFAQEMDFDCECWLEGVGQSSSIRSASMFSGSEDKSANLWVYDGKTLHGPFASGFLLTAASRGAIDESSYVCEMSTINGWLSFKEWLDKQQEKKAA